MSGPGGAVDRRVVITGAGVVSPLGESPADLHAALCEGRPGLRPVTLFGTEGLGCRQAGEVAAFSPKKHLGARNLRPLDRTAQLAAVAAQLALTDSGWSADMRGREEVGLVLGTMFCSVHTIAEFDRRALLVGPEYASPMDFANTVINAAAGQVAIWHNLRGINSTIAAGPTSGLYALAYAADAIRGGMATAVLAGGVEELCFESFYGFHRAGQLCGSDGEGELPIPFDVRRNGFALGEGAALVMLEDATSAAARGARVLGEIRGYGSAYDHRHASPDPLPGEAVARAVRLALADARLTAETLDAVSASANGSRAGDAREVRGLAAALGEERLRRLPVTAIKSMLGEALGASGALQVVAMLEAMREGVLPGIPGLERIDDAFGLEMAGPDRRPADLRTALIDSTGWDGHCCALVLGSAGRS